MENKVCVIGLGLIGGSIALACKNRMGFTVVGRDLSASNLQSAIDLGIVEREATKDDIAKADFFIVAVPVKPSIQIIEELLNQIKPSAVVFDMGSTKNNLCLALKNHPNRKQFVAVHPIAGTEFSGPEAAFETLFDGKVNILCNQEESSKDAIDKVRRLFGHMNMRTIFMDSEEHDRHIAYVSHLSHVSSFMLGKTVLEIEKDEKNIFDMAGSGFESTVRLAKSSPAMWSSIFVENKAHILTALNGYIENLSHFRDAIEQEDSIALEGVMKDTNYIKEVLKGIK